MSERTVLERRYRRVLAWYPRSFRDQCGDEMLGVLLDGAAPGQARVGVAEAWDLVRGGVRMRLWPAARRPATVRAAVALMVVGAAAELAALVTAAVTWGAVRAAAVRDPAASLVLVHQVVVLAGAPVAAGMWLWLAWANGQGRDWARLLSGACFALLTLTVAGSLAQHAAAYAPATTIAAAVVWAIGLASVVLIFTPAAGRYYRPPLAQQ